MWPEIPRKKHHCEFYCHFILNIYSFFVIQYYLIMVLHVLWISYKFIQKLYKNLYKYSYSGGRFLNKIIIKKQNRKSHINWCCVYNKGTWTYMFYKYSFIYLHNYFNVSKNYPLLPPTHTKLAFRPSRELTSLIAIEATKPETYTTNGKIATESYRKINPQTTNHFKISDNLQDSY